MGLENSMGQVDETLLKAEKDRQDKQKLEQPEMQNPFYISTPGNYQIRILPPHKDMAQQVWLRKTVQYYIKLGPKEGEYVSVDGSRNDAITRAKEQLIVSENPELMEKAKSLSMSNKYLVNALVVSAPPGVEYEVGKVYTIKLGEQAKRQLIELDQEKTMGWEGIWKLEDGVNINISRQGTGINTTYTATPHGLGRSNVLTYLKEAEIDLNSVELHNLDNACPLATEKELTDLLQRGGFIPKAPVAPPPTAPTPMSEEPEPETPAPPSLPNA